ncbi:vegetative cell wall protein gp1 [Plutella xylostella]|uniref:vegetative cell wall protein gp1 n=1 Tax=Plutella xylostella TaxID=51655 RepID=UPI0020325150|nr:vegetative cell wall protein gp1 [Plutella xylostella]
MMVETMLECSQDFGGMSGAGVPQWKRELLQRRLARPRPPPPAPPPPPPPQRDDEDLRYGPGIVKRLQSRYLSLALREQPRRRSLRRAASLELLDAPAPRPAPRPASLALPPPRRDSVKRARSVDALSRLERRPPSPVAPAPPPAAPAPAAAPPGDAPPAEPGQPRAGRPPRRPQPLLRQAERPPPDLVRSALRKFEGSGGRRGAGGSAPAARVAAVVRGLEPREPSPAPGEPRRVPRAALDGIARAGSTTRYAFPATPPPPAARAPLPPPPPPLAATNPVLARRVGVIRPLPPAAPPPPPRPDHLRLDKPAPRLASPEPAPAAPPAPAPPAAPAAPAAPWRRASLDATDRAHDRTQSPDHITSPDKIVSPEKMVSPDKVVSPDKIITIDKIITPDKCLSPDKSISPDKIIPLEKIMSPDKLIAPDIIIIPEKIITHEKILSPNKITFADKILSSNRVLSPDRMSPLDKTFTSDRIVSPDKSSTVEKTTSPDKNTSLDDIPFMNKMRDAEKRSSAEVAPLVNGHAGGAGEPRVNGKACKISAAKIERGWSPGERRAPAPAPAPWGRAGAARGAPAAVSVVFNFSSRAEVPDYIENDGVILRASKRDKLKPGDPGVVVLDAAAAAAAASDSDSDEGGAGGAGGAGEPERLAVRFTNDNVLINGKSSLLARTNRDRLLKLKLQFDDSLTRTFEYPSETSLCEDDSPAPAAPAAAAHPTLTSNTHIASAALAGYTPSKTRAEEFRLGLSRQDPAPPAKTPAVETAEEEEDEELGDVRPCGGAARSWSQARAARTDLLF